ncbi:AMP-binding protein [Streptomyces griseus]|uniref:AMP-binding protein n=1 Tax=Streptomyces griseus TaxID=1911 RepID=UPI000689E143|nr:AMP-binding protein [Streptomyces griseus]
MSEPHTVGRAEWRVVLNDEGQYSIWWTDRELPSGWRAEGTSGARERCLARVQEVWADQRPAGLRRRAAEGVSAEGVCVAEVVARQARRVPGAAAVQGEGFALSFGGLDAASNRWARYLRSLGVGRGTLVGVLLGRGCDLHAVTLGVWKAGAGCLPLDPEFPAARLRALLAATGARVLVTEVAYGPDGFEGQARYVDDPEVCGALARQSDEPLGRGPDPEDVAYVTQVPGGAGRPLAVAVTHRGLVHHVAVAAGKLTSAGDGGSAVFASVASELAATALWVPLCAGQRVLLAPQTLDLAELGDWLTAAGSFAFLKLTSAHLELLVRQLGDTGGAALAGTFVIAGGAPGPAATRLARLLDPGRLRRAYGTAETSYGTLLTSGRPGADAQLRVLDDACVPVPDGSVGELYVAGPGVARGYVGRAALTAQRFVPDPYGPAGTRMHRTGELARRTAAGEVQLVGRTDRQLWVRGHRVDPAETEEALHDHPSVGEAVVIGVQTAPGDVRLAAYVVPRPGAQDLDAAALAAHCGRRLPGHLVPASLTLLDEVPRDADGRVERAALPGQHGQGGRDSGGRPASPGARTLFGGRGLAGLLTAHRVPGACVAVLEDGALVAVEAAGGDGAGRPITPRTAFPVGDLSRHVTALGVLRLVDEGLLALDAEVGRTGDTPVTLADLLGRPGADGAAVPLPALLEDATGETFGPLMRRLVLGPLGLDDSCFGGPPPRTNGRTDALVARVGHDVTGRALDGDRRATDPAELWTTAADLAEVALEIRRSVLGAPLALLARDTAARMLTPGPDRLYGLATMVKSLGSDTEFGHEAAPLGHYAASVLSLRAGRGLVVLTNGRAGDRVGKEIEAGLRRVRQMADKHRTAGDGTWRNPLHPQEGNEVTDT